MGEDRRTGRRKERKREKERRKLREIEREKTQGRIKGSKIIRSLFVVVYSFYYYFVYLSSRWFVTSVLISERLIFLKLVFNTFVARFQSIKHLLNIEKWLYFSVLKSRLFSSCVGID